jgi:hypothetical protein
MNNQLEREIDPQTEQLQTEEERLVVEVPTNIQAGLAEQSSCCACHCCNCH